MHRINCVRSEKPDFQPRGYCTYFLDSAEQVVWLYFNQAQENKLPAFLFRCKTLKSLHVIYTALPKVKWQLPQLQKLVLWVDQDYDFELLKALKSVKELEINAKQTVDLRFLQGFSFLRKLSVYAPEITGLKALTMLPRLEELELLGKLQPLQLQYLNDLSLRSLNLLDYYFINGKLISSLENYSAQRINDSSLEQISAMTNLRSLELSFGQLSTLQPLENLKKLEKLELFDVKVDNLAPLAKLPRLLSLRLKACEIRDLSALKDMKNLRLFGMDRNTAVDPTTVCLPQNLNILSIISTDLQDVSFLDQAKDLIYIDLRRTNIRKTAFPADIQRIGFLSDAWDVSFSRHKLIEIGYKPQLLPYPKAFMGSDAFAIERGSVTAISVKSADMHKLEKIITEFDKLRFLQLNYCKLKDISVLSQLKNLKFLDVSSNYLMRVKPEDFPPSLVYLNIEGNFLVDLNAFKHLVNLQFLDIADNKIASLDGLQALSNLQELRLSLVALREGYEIICQLPKLKFLTVKISPKQQVKLAGKERICRFLNHIYPKARRQPLPVFRDVHLLYQWAFEQGFAIVQAKVYWQISQYHDKPGVRFMRSRKGKVRIVDFNKVKVPQLPQMFAHFKKLYKMTFIQADVQEFPFMPQLRELEIYGQELLNPQIIENLPNLTSLRLHYVKIKNLDFLCKLKRLRQLELVDCEIEQTVSLQDLPPIPKLTIQRTSGIIKIHKALLMAEELNIDDQGFSYNLLDALKDNESVRKLSIDSDQLMTVEFVNQMPALSDIKCFSENLTDLLPIYKKKLTTKSFNFHFHCHVPEYAFMPYPFDVRSNDDWHKFDRVLERYYYIFSHPQLFLAFYRVFFWLKRRMDELSNYQPGLGLKYYLRNIKDLFKYENFLQLQTYEPLAGMVIYAALESFEIYTDEQALEKYVLQLLGYDERNLNFFEPDDLDSLEEALNNYYFAYWSMCAGCRLLNHENLSCPVFPHGIPPRVQAGLVNYDFHRFTEVEPELFFKPQQKLKRLIVVHSAYNFIRSRLREVFEGYFRQKSEDEKLYEQAIKIATDKFLKGLITLAPEKPFWEQIQPFVEEEFQKLKEKKQ